MSRRINKNGINVVQCWLVYVSLVGDAAKTAAALDLSEDAVRKLAEEEGWNEKIRQVCLISKGGKPGDYERQINRCLNFVQAHQTRALIQRIVDSFGDMTEEEILEATSSVAKDGSRHVSGRFWADLSAAMSKVHDMTYQSLGDTCGERSARSDDGPDSMNATDLHLAVMAALSGTKVKATDIVAELAAQQDSTVKQLSETIPVPAEGEQSSCQSPIVV